MSFSIDALQQRDNELSLFMDYDYQIDWHVHITTTPSTSSMVVAVWSTDFFKTPRLREIFWSDAILTHVSKSVLEYSYSYQSLSMRYDYSRTRFCLCDDVTTGRLNFQPPRTLGFSCSLL